MQFLCSTCWARLPVKALSVEAVDLHVHQQHLNHFGHRVGVTGEHAHLNPEVMWAGCVVILSKARQRKKRWGMCRRWAGKNCQCLWTCQAAHLYFAEVFRSVPTCLACLVEQLVIILLRHFLWQINLHAYMKRQKKVSSRHFLTEWIKCALAAGWAHHCTCRLSPFPKCRSRTGHTTA